MTNSGACPGTACTWGLACDNNNMESGQGMLTNLQFDAGVDGCMAHVADRGATPQRGCRVADVSCAPTPSHAAQHVSSERM